MSPASSLALTPSSRQTSSTRKRPSWRTESISIPASVTSRANRSGLITVSAFPFERLRRSATAATGRPTTGAVSKPAS